MKRLVVLLSVILTLAMVFAGCENVNPSLSTTSNAPAVTSQSGASADKTVKKPEVRAWLKKSFSTEADDALVARLEEYGTKTGKCDVVVEIIPNSNFGDKYNVAVESGEVPDVAFMTLYLLRQYYDAGLLLDTEDLVKDIESSGHKLNTQALNASTFDGKVYSVPYYMSSSAFLYRIDYLKQAGWNEFPTTWEDLRKCAKDVTEKVPGVYGFGFTYGKAPDTENLGRSVLFSMGGSLFDESGKPAVTDPKTIEVLKWMCDLYLVDKSVPPTAISWDDAGNNTAFLSGQVAMIVNAASMTQEMQKPENAELAANVGVGNMPSGSNGVKVCSGPQCLSIFKNAKNIELAKEVIKYNMEYDWYKGWVDEMRYGVQPAYEDIKYDDPYISPYIHANDNLVWQGYPGPYTGVAAKAWSTFELSNFFQRVIVDKVSPEQAAQEVQERIEKMMQE